MARFILVGLVEPRSEDQQDLFDKWYLDQHIYDTALCPNFLSGTVYKLVGKHGDGDTVADYLAIYEVNADSYEEAERVLNAWQRDPTAWEGRVSHNKTLQDAPGAMPLKVNGSGWYEFERAYHTRG